MIRLFDGYVIDSDPYQYILGKPMKTVGKDGKESVRMQDATYHKTLKQAVDSFINMEQRGLVRDNDMSLSEAIIKIRQLRDIVMDILVEPQLAAIGD